MMDERNKRFLRRTARRTRAVRSAGTRGGAWVAVYLVVALAPAAALGQDTDAELKRKLIESTAGGGEDDVMARIMALMKETARLLEVEFDPGKQTQSTQELIVKELDDAIKQASANTRRNKSSSSSSSDRRAASRAPSEQASRPKPDAGAKGPSRNMGESTAQDAPAGDGRIASSRQRELAERRRGWGHLPMRDRDEVIEGMDERVLPRFKEWAERYYRALQEAGDETD